MPSPRVLLRCLLMFVLCANGVVVAWASTRMATAAASVTATVTDSSTADSSGQAVDCGQKERPGVPAGGSGHDDCDCAASDCACTILTLYPMRPAQLFAARHVLGTAYLPPPLMPAVRHQISRVFRPPIA